jgi:hypothetical protein
MVGQAAVRQGSDQSTTARGHPVELRYGAVACWSIIFGGSSFFLKCPNINIYIYTYIHNNKCPFLTVYLTLEEKLSNVFIGRRTFKFWWIMRWWHPCKAVRPGKTGTEF